MTLGKCSTKSLKQVVYLVRKDQRNFNIFSNSPRHKRKYYWSTTKSQQNILWMKNEIKKKKSVCLWMCVWIVWALKRIWNVENEFEFNEWYLNQSKSLKPHHSIIPHPATRFKVSRYTHERTQFYAKTQIHSSIMLTNTFKHEY